MKQRKIHGKHPTNINQRNLRARKKNAKKETMWMGVSHIIDEPWNVQPGLLIWKSTYPNASV